MSSLYGSRRSSKTTDRGDTGAGTGLPSTNGRPPVSSFSTYGQGSYGQYGQQYAEQFSRHYNQQLEQGLGSSYGQYGTGSSQYDSRLYGTGDNPYAGYGGYGTIGAGGYDQSYSSRNPYAELERSKFADTSMSSTAGRTRPTSGRPTSAARSHRESSFSPFGDNTKGKVPQSKLPDGKKNLKTPTKYDA